MSEPNFSETLSGPKGLKPDFAAALAHAQSLSKEEAEAVFIAGTIANYADPSVEIAREVEQFKSDGLDAKKEVESSVLAVEALWAWAGGDETKIKKYVKTNDAEAISLEFYEDYEPEIHETKRETRLVTTTNPSIGDDKLTIFMLSGAGEIAGFDDLDTIDLDSAKEVLESVKQHLGVAPSGPSM